jgi:hypothetical protein
MRRILNDREKEHEKGNAGSGGITQAGPREVEENKCGAGRSPGSFGIAHAGMASAEVEREASAHEATGEASTSGDPGRREAEEIAENGSRDRINDRIARNSQSLS